MGLKFEVLQPLGRLPQSSREISKTQFKTLERIPKIGIIFGNQPAGFPTVQYERVKAPHGNAEQFMASGKVEEHELLLISTRRGRSSPFSHSIQFSQMNEGLKCIIYETDKSSNRDIPYYGILKPEE